MRLSEKCPCGRTEWCGFDKKPCVALIPLGHRIRLRLSLPDAQDPPETMANKPADMANSMANTGSDMANTGESMANRSAYQYRNPEARRAYMREYMARRRAQKKSPAG